MKTIVLLTTLIGIAILGGCSLSDLSPKNSSSNSSKGPIIRYLGTGENVRGGMRGRNRMGTGLNHSGFDFKNGTGFMRNFDERMNLLSTGDQELLKKMMQYRSSGNYTGAQEIRETLMNKYPELFSGMNRGGFGGKN